jgi:hypothetical protein
MRSLTGAVLLLTGEQAFSHAYLVTFPHQAFVQTILLPFAAVTTIVGMLVLIRELFRGGKTA